MSRYQIKNFAETCLPGPISDSVKFLWRKYYWSNQRKSAAKRHRITLDRINNSSRPVKLELGSWKRAGMEDWIASDINGGGDLQLDLLKPFPLRDGTVEKIYSSHLLEHFSYPQPMLGILSECLRVLTPDGEFSIAVPDAEMYIKAYTNNEQLDLDLHCGYDVGLNYENRIDYVNFIAHLGGEHKHLFDRKNLISILQEAGFKNARLREFDPAVDLEQRNANSLYAIAIK